MAQCRSLTLDLFQDVDQETFCCQPHPDFSPIGWHLGHIGYTEALWLLEQFARLPPQFPQYRQLFAADGLPKCDRVHLPTLAATQTYLAAIRFQVLEYLQVAPLEQQERIWRWLLQHESQHCETIALVLQLIRHPRTSQFSQVAMPTEGCPPTAMVCIPAGTFQLGNEAIDALDNERPIQQVFLPTYWLDRYPVTCQQYAHFIAAGGYQHSHWWSAAGWAWLQSSQVIQPRYWCNDSVDSDRPVCGVSWYEADAYARFVGKRLPTEAEWEKAASWQPQTQRSQPYPWGRPAPDQTRCNHSHLVGKTTAVTAYPQGASAYGCHDLLGNVWEWTSDRFAGYDGFVPFPYRGYSQTYFDGQHYVLKGGSWATRSWALRAAFRNWYHPHVREVLAGFRCASSEAMATNTQ